MGARLTMDERAELERLRLQNEALREEVAAWKGRRATDAAEPLRVGPITLWPDQGRAEIDGRPIHLTGRQRTLLECLARRKNATVNKDAILDFLYGGLDEPEAKIIDVMVCAVRRKLREFGADRHLQTVWGIGYRLSDLPAEDAYTRSDRPGGRPSRPAETLAYRAVCACEDGPKAKDDIRLPCSNDAKRMILSNCVRAGRIRRTGARYSPVYEITAAGREYLRAVRAPKSPVDVSGDRAA